MTPRFKITLAAVIIAGVVFIMRNPKLIDRWDKRVKDYKNGVDLERNK